MTAYVPTTAISDGTTAVFSVAFPYLDKTHVHVYDNDAAYAGTVTWNTPTQVSLSPVPVAGHYVAIKRATPIDTPVVSFSGGTLASASLNNETTQLLFAIQEATYEAGRSVVTQDGEARLILPTVAQRASKFAAYDGAGNPTAVTGGGGGGGPTTDFGAALVAAEDAQAGRNVLGDYTTTFEVGGALANGSDDEAHILASLNVASQSEGSRTYALGSALAMPTGKAITGLGEITPVSSGYTDHNLVTLASGSKVQGLTFNGTGLPSPTSGWAGVGVPVGCAFYAAGADDAHHLQGITLRDVTVQNLPSGGMFIKYADDISISNYFADHTQVRSDTNADVELYHVARVMINGVKIVDHLAKGMDLDYVAQGVFTDIITSGGSAGFGALHSVGGSQQVWANWSHNGSTGPTGTAYGFKTWNDIGTVFANFSTANGDAMQIYGSSGVVFANGVVIDPAANAIAMDTYEASSSINRVMVSNLSVYYSVGAQNNTALIAINIRGDKPTSPGTNQTIDEVVLNNITIDGGWIGVHTVPQGNLIDNIAIRGLRVRNLGTSGYPVLVTAKNIDVDDFVAESGVHCGMFFGTDSSTRGGTLKVNNATFRPGLSAASQSAVVVGVPSTQEAAFATVIIRGLHVDAAGDTHAEVLRCDFTAVDELVELTLENITGVNLAVGTPVLITFYPSTSQKLVLNMKNVSLTDTNGAPALVSITNPSSVVGGQITNCNLKFSTGSRPAACVPYHAALTATPGAISSGSQTSSTVTVTGAAVNDKVDVAASIALSGCRVWGEVTSANTVTVYWSNNTGSSVTLGAQTVDVWVTPHLGN